MSFGRIIWLIVVALVLTALVYTGVWQIVPLFIWEFPILTWLPLLALLVVGYLAGTVRYLAAREPVTPQTPTTAPADPSAIASPTQQLAATSAGTSGFRPKFWFGPGFLAGLIVLLLGL